MLSYMHDKFSSVVFSGEGQYILLLRIHIITVCGRTVWQTLTLSGRLSRIRDTRARSMRRLSRMRDARILVIRTIVTHA